MSAPQAGGPLAGRLALVTGASRGIGLAIAQALETAGAQVVRLARSLPDRSEGRRTDIPCDLTDAAAVDRMVRRLGATLGTPDIVVNNAGVFVLKPLEETTPAEFADALRTNLTAPFLLVRALMPALRARGRGHLVTIGSVADHVPLSGSSAYAASKFGLRGLHGVLAAELAGSGVRLTLVSPGPVDTPIWDPIDPDARPGFTPRGEMLRPADVAEAVLFAVTRPPAVELTELRLSPARRRRDG